MKSRQPLPGEEAHRNVCQEFLPAELHACGVLAPLPFIVIQAPQMAVAPIPGEVTGFLGGEHRRGAGAGMDGLEETTGAIARTLEQLLEELKAAPANVPTRETS